MAAAGLLAACSSSGSPQGAGNTPAAAASSATPTAPSAALCTEARTLVANAQGTFAADAEAPEEQQATDDGAFYTHLHEVLVDNDGTDPVSLPVSQDAALLVKDYGALDLAAQNHDLDGQTTALGALSRDLGQLGSDQTAFDTACGIPVITPTN